MTTTQQLVGITAQHNEIVKRMAGGSLDATAVKRALQDIIEGKIASLSWKPPTWWRTPNQQIERARELWPYAVLPEPPKEFTPRTKSEVLLLHVPDSFDSLWDKVVAPQKDGVSYTKYRWSGVESDMRNVSLSPNRVEFTQPVWLAFDPEHGKGERSNSFRDRADCAASEVFSALIQFPEWSLAWFAGSSAPNLSGYQLKYDEDWSCVPCLEWWDDGRRLTLHGHWAIRADDSWASPSVRVC